MQYVQHQLFVKKLKNKKIWKDNATWKDFSLLDQTHLT